MKVSERKVRVVWSRLGADRGLVDVLVVFVCF